MSLRTIYPDVWGGGQLLAFSGLDGATDYERGLVARTSFDRTGFDVKLPGNCRIILSDDAPYSVKLTGDHFDMTTSSGRVRGAYIDTYHLLIEGQCMLEEKSHQVKSLSSQGRTLVGSADHFDGSLIKADMKDLFRRRSAWLRSLPLPAQIPYSLLRPLRKAYSQIKTMFYAPQGFIGHRFTTPDRWPHRAMWLWDSAFHAIGLRHLDPGLARDSLNAVFDVREPEGRIPLCADPKTKDPRFTQPPVLALAVQLADASAPDRDWVESVYPHLAAYVRWNLANRDPGGDGLLRWATGDKPTCRCAESGMDNSPRFDKVRSPVAVDFNSLIAHECEILAGLAGSLGLPREEAAWNSTYGRLAKLINSRLWNEKLGLYVDSDTDGKQIPIMASTGFFPLICGITQEKQAQRLLAALSDRKSFGTPLRVASIAACEEAYTKDMWRGPVWINTNWLIAYGLERSGYTSQAEALRWETVTEIARLYEVYGTFFEFYDDRREVDPPQLLRKGECAPQKDPFKQVFHDYGWTATLFVDLIFKLFTGQAN